MSGILNLEGQNAVIAVKMMKNVSSVLEKAEIPYILEAGTLLGVIRENRLLPWDNDVDFTITRQYEAKLRKNLWKFFLKGYSVRVKYYNRDLKYFKKGEVRIIRVKHINPLKLFKKDVILEIFLKKKIGNEYYWTVGVKEPVLKSVPERFYDNHTKYQFEGKMFSVPEDYIGYLEEHYGKNWRTPIKEWDYRTSDCSVKEFL